LDFAIQLLSNMKLRKREKQIGVRLHADQHAALREIAKREGYDSISDFIRAILEKEIKRRSKVPRLEFETKHRTPR
jgi:uncharacterized protein (DUF1778 family)